jgi:hypothetical protein
MSKNLVSLLLASIMFSFGSSFIIGIAIFNNSGIGYVIGRAIFPVFVSIMVSLILAVVYWLFKRKKMPYLNALIWIIWALTSIMSLLGSIIH